MTLLRAPLLLLLVLPSADGPVPKFPLGKDTTYVTGPLDKEGYIDYQAALNDRLGKGITPEKNANVLLAKALGPRPDGAPVPPEFFKRLGIAAPPQQGEYFISIASYGKNQLKLKDTQLEPLFDQQDRASQRPWTPKDYPDVAGWLKANEKPLALVLEASRRPDYYNPLVSAEKGPGGIIGALLPSAQKCREVAIALAARALLHVGEGKCDQAWNDLLACHRLGRLVARGGTLIEGLVGIAVDQVASNADLGYLACPNLTARQIESSLEDLQALPPLPPIADKIDLAERFLNLDCLQMIRRGGVNQVEALMGGPTSKKLDPATIKPLAAIDWSPGLRTVNQWFDRLVAAMRTQDRDQREKAIDKIMEEVKAQGKKAVGVTAAIKLLLAADRDKAAGKSIADVLIGLLIPGVGKVQHAWDRNEQIHRNLELAFALAAFRHDEGRYPETLAALAPKYLKTIPSDLFSSKAIIYRPSANGYLLYSVGVNGRDEGGRTSEDKPPGDDLSVRMPLPALKPPQ